MYANDDSDSESTSKATTPGRSTTAEVSQSNKLLTFKTQSDNSDHEAPAKNSNIEGC